jgi:hypothetical protein
MFTRLITFLLGSGVTFAFCVWAFLSHPEKVEKWLALFWKIALKIGVSLRLAQKKYVQYDIQGRVNDFIKRHSKEMPGFQVKGVKVEWADAGTKRNSFIEKDQVVVRVRSDDPHHENFVKAAYLFISTSLLYRAKRYISPSQGRAIDLFVATAVFKEEKPEVVDHFLEEYLHPHLDEVASKVEGYFGQFDAISNAGLFFPVFLQEMDYLGQKVFGNRRSQQIVTEVDGLVEFLQNIALRRVGDDKTELNFVRQYCRFAVVIVGKPTKLTQSISPYVKFVRSLNRNIETVYLTGLAENEKRIKQVCEDLSDLYDTVSEKKSSKVIHYGDEKRRIKSFVAVLRARSRELFAAATSSH